MLEMMSDQEDEFGFKLNLSREGDKIWWEM